MKKTLKVLMLAVLLGGGTVALHQALAQGGASESSDPSEAAEQQESSRLAKSVSMTKAQAEAIAREIYSGNGRVTEVGLEKENGKVLYAVEFTESDGNEVDVKIDSQTGNLVVIEDDRTDKETE